MKKRTLSIGIVLLSILLLAPAISSAQGRGNAWGRDNDRRPRPVRPNRPNRPVSAVPEPGAALLFGAGLLAVSAVTRRRDQE